MVTYFTEVDKKNEETQAICSFKCVLLIILEDVMCFHSLSYLCGYALISSNNLIFRGRDS